MLYVNTYNLFLMLAASPLDAEIIKWLVEAGVDVNETASLGAYGLYAKDVAGPVGI